MFGKIEINYYDIDEILNYIEELGVKMTPQLKYDISHLRKPIPKKYIKIINDNYNNTFKQLLEEHKFDEIDKTFGMYYSSILHNGKRGL